MRITLTNAEASSFADACERFLDDKGLLGYACARNARRLTDASLEYIQRRERAIREYGIEVKDGSGNVTGYHIEPGSDAMARFAAELSPIASIEVEADVMTIPASEVIGKLTGRDVLTLDWMIEDGA